MSAPEHEVIAYAVPLAQTAHLAPMGEGPEDEGERMPLAILDFDNSPEAARVLFQLMGRPEGSPTAEVFYEPWVPLPGALLNCDPVRELGPAVVFTVPLPAAHGQVEPATALSFRVAVDENGSFMRHATAAEHIGIAAALPADWPADVEAPDAQVLVLSHDPLHLAWVELLAWRGALAHERPDSYQPALPLD